MRSLLSFLCLVATTCATLTSLAADDAVEVVPLPLDSQPTPPEAALATMKVPSGYRVELVAAEPLVMDPIAFDWGPDGRLWVVEMGDYPKGATWHRPGDPLDVPGGRIKVLSDSNGDGQYDTATVFLDGLSFPTGVKIWDKGVLITAAPEIFYAEDSKVDGKADKREMWYEGFAESNQQHRVNGLVWGLDNWLHVANGDGGGIIRAGERRDEVDIRGFDLRIDPFTRAYEPLNGRTQCGRFSDDWGNWFGCNNSNPLWHYPYPWHFLRRNAEVTIPRAFVNVPKIPGAAPVYPISPTLERFNELDRANRFTSACGPTIYRDVLLGEEIYGNAFTCEPVHNLVSRQILTAAGATFRSDRHPDEQASEFFASTDPWSRPVYARTGPDGALWIADMYRFVIEHPEWIPQEWQERLDLRAGSDRGRIYRIVPDRKESPTIPRFDQLDEEELVAQLESENGTVRDLVHQMLLWKRSPETIPFLKTMAESSAQPLARTHALAALDGLGALDAETIARGLSSEHPGVVRHAVRLSAGRVPLATLAALPEAMLDDPFVALELAGQLVNGGEEAALLANLIDRHLRDPYVTAVALSSVNRSTLLPVLEELDLSTLQEHTSASLLGLTRMAARWKDEASLRLLLNSLLQNDKANDGQHFAVLSTLFDGGTSLSTLTSLANEANRSRLKALLQTVRQTVADTSLPLEKRLEAIRFLGHPAVFDDQKDLDLLLTWTAPRATPAQHAAAIEALGRTRLAQTPEILVERWGGFTPSSRSKVLTLLMSRPDWTGSLITAIESGRISPSEVDAPSRAQLLKTNEETLRQRAEKLFASSHNPSRESVVKAHADVATMTGNPSVGKTVFAATCAICHLAEGVGNTVGPDLSALNDRSPETLLVAILDPNRAVEDRFVNYTVTTTKGESILGSIANESTNTVTLQQIDGSTREIPRDDIETIVSSGLSLMPEGFENTLNKQQLADLIAYLAKLGSSPETP